LLLERLPPTEEFMKNFAVEVLGYLLSPFFDDNDELLGIEITDLGYNKLGEEINHNLGAFIWKPNNLFWILF
jgi:hypothetical protein